MDEENDGLERQTRKIKKHWKGVKDSVVQK